MMRIYKVIALSLLLMSSSCWADDPDQQAKSFQQIFTSLCAKNINNLDALKEQLKQVPKFPPEQAAKFLNGLSGNAWPVPDKAGLFVLSLPDNKNMCVVYARRANVAMSEQQFINFLASAPSPL